MSVKLTCPVCDRSQVSEIICPNCATDLSTYKMLADLPRQTPIEVTEKKRIIPIWLPVTIAVLFLLLGLSLGIVGKSIIAQKQLQVIEPYLDLSDSISSIKSDSLGTPMLTETSLELRRNRQKYCGGFNYMVRNGDSLSLIAYRLYGDIQYLSLISDANEELKGKENDLEIGEHLFIPNIKDDC